MHEALLYDRLDGGTVHCRLCPWDCQIPPGEKGRCLVRENHEGTLDTLNYGLVSAAALDPIERRGLYHLFPGCMVLSLGGWGTNLSCRYQRATPALPTGEQVRFLDPEKAVSFAVERRCRGVAWGFQEPTVWMEYLLDSAMLVRANGMFTLMITNGYITTEALDLLGPYLDAYTVEILSVSPRPYESLCDLPRPDAILEGTAHMLQQWRCHVEVHTPLIPGINDQDETVSALATWIRDALGPDVPWHLWRYEPAGELADRSTTSPEALAHANELGRQSGLRYVYTETGQAGGLAPTVCPSCGNLIVRRGAQYSVKVVGLEGRKCSQCGQEIYLRRSIFK
jgi:pyruvate formate lyase activating enzyme